MEMGEIIAMPPPHIAEKCPFCPPPKDEDFVSHPGAKASGTTLAQIMVSPEDLVSKQAGARPKDGGAERQAKPSAKPKPNPPLSHPTFGPYSYEAHHLIPGKQDLLKNEGDQKVLDGHPIEKWLCKGPNIKKDTGYSINNSDNGVWLASAPESVKKLRGRSPARPWEREDHPSPHPNALTQAEKNEIADFAMESAGQFHYGKHAITDEAGSAASYPKVVHTRLTQLNDRITAWSKECPLCGKKPSNPPYDPSWKVNEMMDLISMWIQMEIQMSGPQSWTYFISSHAMRRSKAVQKKVKSF
ncbi:AHH domain-containing protein [Pyxidicoccus fallax]|uniref:Uncharacterized protein n=1 Tax=Pyxidicoccus fallax TaxID=394095 RepID=A0A848LNK9_9BACT|nr:AHH domain-containing protein [Pyxidicoccus fallax]NMO19242.1 hypothetical protein [Pyxidicoccus fallax]NPC79813.1 AHH domain-containing protein [Pyxidicoccus fallax]